MIKNPNTAGRPKGSQNKRTIIREALQATFPDGELGFWLAVATQAKAGDLQAAGMIANRLYPNLKPEQAPVVLSEPLNGTPQEMVTQIVNAVSRGEISISAAFDFVKLLNDGAETLQQLQILNKQAPMLTVN